MENAFTRDSGKMVPNTGTEGVFSFHSMITMKENTGKIYDMGPADINGTMDEGTLENMKMTHDMDMVSFVIPMEKSTKVDLIADNGAGMGDSSLWNPKLHPVRMG
jgi:hypothetical protein